MWVLPSDDGSSAGGANRIHTKGIVKNDAFGCEAIQLRGWIEWLECPGVCPHSLGGVVIRHDEENVGPLCGPHSFSKHYQ
jgi:hypothetical protein